MPAESPSNESAELQSDSELIASSFPLKQYAFNFTSVIGKGSYGVVYKGKDRRRGDFVAGKMIHAQGKEINDVLTEIKKPSED